MVNPTVDDISTGGQKYLPMKDGSFLAWVMRRPSHKVKMTVKTDMRNIAAFRLELLTDPNCRSVVRADRLRALVR